MEKKINEKKVKINNNKTAKKIPSKSPTFG
jgi:hypothetical protein